MSGFELAVLLAGGAAITVYIWSVQYLGKTLTAAGDKLDNRLERLLGELVRLSGQLHTIQESFQELDKK